MGATRAAQRVRQCKFGGASRPWLPLWGSWRAISEPERVFAVANMEKVRRLRLGTLSVTAFSRDSSPIGRAKGRASPAQRTEMTTWVNWRRSRPWLPLWGSWRAISEPERAFAVANMEKVRRLRLGTLSVTAFSRDCSPIGRAKGRASPAQSRPAQSAEAGAPQRCGLTARVAGSSLPAGSTRPLSHGCAVPALP